MGLRVVKSVGVFFPPTSSRSASFVFCLFFPGSGKSSSSPLSMGFPLPGTPSPRDPTVTTSCRASFTPVIQLSSVPSISFTSPSPSGYALFLPVSLAIHLSTCIACEQNPASPSGHPCLSPIPKTAYPASCESGPVSIRKSLCVSSRCARNVFIIVSIS